MTGRGDHGLPIQKPVISVVIGTRSRKDIYERFVKSVIDNASVFTEIVVGDATQENRYAHDFVTSNVATGAWVCVRVNHESPPLGMLRGYNQCFRRCNGEWVAWFNEDCELLPGWDVAAMSFMRQNETVGLGAVYFSDRDEDGSYGPFRVYSYPFSAPHANFGFIRRDLGEKIGWFDERLGWGYGSDSAFGLQVIAYGKAVTRIPGCKCIHHRAWDNEMNQNHVLHRMNDLRMFKQLWPFAKTYEMSLKHLEQYANLLGPETIA